MRGFPHLLNCEFTLIYCILVNWKKLIKTLRVGLFEPTKLLIKSTFENIFL